MRLMNFHFDFAIRFDFAFTGARAGVR